MGGVIKALGKIAAPIVGIATGNPLLGAAIGAGSGLFGEGDKIKNALGGGALGAGGALVNKILPDEWLSKIGSFATSPGVLGDASGKLDPKKLLALGLGAGGVVSNEEERKKAEKVAGAQTDLRNQLMSKILAPSDYRLSP